LNQNVKKVSGEHVPLTGQTTLTGGSNYTYTIDAGASSYH